jgi:DNA (cytosine-5)-methyltransferase 1
VAGLNQEFGIDFFLFENVPGFAGSRHNLRFQRMKGRLERAGFHISEGLLDARNFGVPQIRPRVFVAGINREKYGSLEFALPTRSRARTRNVADAIRGLPKPLFFTRQLNGRKHPLHPNHWCMYPKSARFDGSLELDPRKRSFRVLQWEQPSYTVAYGHREVHVHPSRRRRLSVFEAMLLQGFPRRYELMGTLTDQIRLISDAVPPPVARALAAALRRQLSI